MSNEMKEMSFFLVSTTDDEVNAVNKKEFIEAAIKRLNEKIPDHATEINWDGEVWFKVPYTQKELEKIKKQDAEHLQGTLKFHQEQIEKIQKELRSKQT